MSFATLAVALFDPRWRLMRRCLKAWGSAWFWAGGVAVRVEGRDHLAPWLGTPVLLVGNHQSTLDIPLLMSTCDGLIRFFAKRELFHLPFTGWAMRAMRCVPIDRANLRRTYATLEAESRGIRRCPAGLVVFPEGTRTRTGDLLPYHRGTFALAQRLGLPVVPFAIAGAAEAMPAGAWAPRPATIRVAFGPAIPAEDVVALDPEEVLRRARHFTESALHAFHLKTPHG